MLLLVPATLATGSSPGGQPLAPPHEEDTLELVQRRLATELTWLKRAGVNVDGEVGSSDPMQAVTDVLDRREFDEVIVSTFPPGVSRWLRMDLPNRIRRRSKLPVTHVECKQPR
jgi:nucleotide-binding universal stress UspA family protein